VREGGQGWASYMTVGNQQGEAKKIMMKTPSGKLIPFEVWIKGHNVNSIVNDIKKMLVLTNKEVARLAALRVRDPSNQLVPHPDARLALEYTYFMMLLLVVDTTKPIPVDDEPAAETQQPVK